MPQQFPLKCKFEDISHPNRNIRIEALIELEDFFSSNKDKNSFINLSNEELSTYIQYLNKVLITGQNKEYLLTLKLLFAVNKILSNSNKRNSVSIKSCIKELWNVSVNMDSDIRGRALDLLEVQGQNQRGLSQFLEGLNQVLTRKDQIDKEWKEIVIAMLENFRWLKVEAFSGIT